MLCIDVLLWLTFLKGQLLREEALRPDLFGQKLLSLHGQNVAHTQKCQCVNPNRLHTVDFKFPGGLLAQCMSAAPKTS